MSDSEEDAGDIAWSQQEVGVEYRKMMASQAAEKRAAALKLEERKQWLEQNGIKIAGVSLFVVVAFLWWTMPTEFSAVVGLVGGGGLGYWTYLRSKVPLQTRISSLLNQNSPEKAKEAHAMLTRATQELHKRAAKPFNQAKAFLMNEKDSEFVRVARAQPHREAADKIARSIVKDDSSNFQQAFFTVGNLYKALGDWKTCDSLFEQLQKQWKLLAGGDQKEIDLYRQFLQHYASACTEHGEHKKAEKLMQDVNAILQVRAEDDEEGAGGVQFAQGQLELAVTFLQAGNWKKATPPLLKAQGILGKIEGMKCHPLHIAVLRHLATAAQQGRDLKQAQTYLEEAVENMSIAEGQYREAQDQGQMMPDGNPVVVDDVLKQRCALQRELAMMHMLQRQFKEAEEIMTTSRDALSEAFGDSCDEVLEKMSLLAHIYKNAGGPKDERVLPLLTDVSDRLKARDGENSQNYASSLRRIAELNIERKQLSEAGKLYDRALKALDGAEKAGKDIGMERLQVLEDSAGVCQKNNDKDGAKEKLHECLRLLADKFGEKDPRVAIMMGSIANLHMENKNWAEAEPMANMYLAIIRDVLRLTGHHQRALDMNIALLNLTGRAQSPECQNLMQEHNGVRHVVAKMQQGMSMEQIAAEMQQGSGKSPARTNPKKNKGSKKKD
jgi:tetratricopeptide (TPR) repeat protein